jgi:NAD(P) transhydrogenase
MKMTFNNSSIKLFVIIACTQLIVICGFHQLHVQPRYSYHRIKQNSVLASSSNASTLSSTISDDDTFDLAVVGAGPVGVRASILAASTYHKKVALIDAPRASGVLMNEESQQDLSIGGPTGLFSKALRDVSKQIKVSTLRGMGLREDSIWNEITSSCLELAKLNADDVFRQLEYANVEYIEGFVCFDGSDDNTSTEKLIISSTNPAKRIIKAKNILIATGSKPFRPDSIPFDGKRIFDSDSINQLSYLPSSIAITGSG